MRTQRKPVRLQVEKLEDRALMAGNVTVTNIMGTIQMEGDAVANQVQLSSPSPGVYRVTGLAGTKINGQSTAQTFNTTSPATLRVNLQDGDDSLRTSGAVALGQVQIAMGKGNDIVQLDRVSVSLDTEIRTDVDSDLPNTGLDQDQVLLTNCNFVRTDIRTGRGADRVTLIAVTAGGAGFDIETGDGNDTVVVEGSSLRGQRVDITTGGGNDRVQIANSTLSARNVGISTGAGRDSVTISRVTGRNFGVDLGSSDSADGNNQLTIVASTFTSDNSIPALLSGGGGKNDRLNRSGNTFDVAPNLFQWELIV